MTDGHNLGGCTTTTDTNSDVEVLEAVGTEEENGFPDLKAKGSWFEELKGLSVNFDEASTGGSVSNSGGVLLSAEALNLLCFFFTHLSLF